MLLRHIIRLALTVLVALADVGVLRSHGRERRIVDHRGVGMLQPGQGDQRLLRRCMANRSEPKPAPAPAPEPTPAGPIQELCDAAPEVQPLCEAVGGGLPVPGGLPLPV